MDLLKESLSDCQTYKVEIHQGSKGSLYSVLFFEYDYIKKAYKEVTAVHSLANSMERAEKLARAKIALFTKEE